MRWIFDLENFCAIIDIVLESLNEKCSKYKPKKLF